MLSMYGICAKFSNSIKIITLHDGSFAHPVAPNSEHPHLCAVLLPPPDTAGDAEKFLLPIHPTHISTYSNLVCSMLYTTLFF